VRFFLFYTLESADSAIGTSGKNKKPRTAKQKKEEEVGSDLFSSLPLDVVLDVRFFLPSFRLRMRSTSEGGVTAEKRRDLLPEAPY
jgi:hypothetical protein